MQVEFVWFENNWKCISFKVLESDEERESFVERISEWDRLANVLTHVDCQLFQVRLGLRKTIPAEMVSPFSIFVACEEQLSFF